jgi:hypothetical protein
VLFAAAIYYLPGATEPVRECGGQEMAETIVFPPETQMPAEIRCAGLNHPVTGRNAQAQADRGRQVLNFVAASKEGLNWNH